MRKQRGAGDVTTLRLTLVITDSERRVAPYSFQARFAQIEEAQAYGEGAGPIDAVRDLLSALENDLSLPTLYDLMYPEDGIEESK